ncbi:MAG: plasmid pRiA4b ORF-3 family protein [Chlorobium sp.]
MRPQTPKSIYQLKVTLMGSKPPIWRRILVADTITLGKLHTVMQAGMGWFDEHLHQFVFGRELYGVPDEDEKDLFFGMSVIDENMEILSSLLRKEKDSLTYEYDFGDGWQHKVTLEKILSFDSAISLPSCIKGKGACPPEDCGGIWGYRELVEVMSDKLHPDYADRTEWLAESFGITDFNPELCDLEAVNSRLRRECR